MRYALVTLVQTCGLPISFFLAPAGSPGVEDRIRSHLSQACADHAQGLSQIVTEAELGCITVQKRPTFKGLKKLTVRRHSWRRASRSDERCVGEECRRSCRHRGVTYSQQTNKTQQK